MIALGLWRRGGLPLALLLLALATLFLFAEDHGQFYRPGHHDWLSSRVLAITDNASAEYGFTRFDRLEPDQDGNPQPYGLYNRFPIGGYLLIKLATLPFGEDLSAKILAARTLMLACFSAAVVLAYLALASTIGSRWIACAATALAFSSYYCVYYKDMITTEVPVDLFAVMLAFHGMAIFVSENRFPQLLVKTCIALALGWHVYTALLLFIAFSLASELVRAHRVAPLGSRVKHFSKVIFLGWPLQLGVTAFAFGLLVLSANLLSEYYLLDGNIPATGLPTWNSMMMRMGQIEWFQTLHGQQLHWPNFLESQLQILGRMSFPYSLPGYISLPLGHHASLEAAWMASFLPVSIAALAVCLVWLCFHPQRILLATLTMFGLLWALLMKHSVAFHDFESVFYVGVPLTLFSLVLLQVDRLGGKRLMAGAAVAALLVFVFSNWQMSRTARDANRQTFHAEVMSDFQAIRRQTSDGVTLGVLLAGTREQDVGATWALEYYLAQRIFLPIQYPPASKPELEELRRVWAANKAFDLVVTNWREPEVDTLTPENRRFFLYSGGAFASLHDSLLGELLARDKFDVYLRANTLTYLKSPCSEADTAPEFALHVLPRDAGRLPEYRRQYGMENLGFDFEERGARFPTQEGQTCLAWVGLPAYDIQQVRTGQFNEEGRTWWVESSLTSSAQ